jgi:hypothetical protein
MLYGAAWRAARAMGYHRLITYTQVGESGASLRAAGLRPAAVLRARPGWDAPSRPRATHNVDHIERVRWEVTTSAGTPARLPPSQHPAASWGRAA